MRLTDPRLWRLLAPARGSLALVGLCAVLTSGALVWQAIAIAGLLTSVFQHTSISALSIAIVVVIFVVRALVTLLGDVAADHAAGRVSAHLRRLAVRAIILRGGRESAGSLTALATSGVDAAEPYVTRYVPAFVMAMVLPVITIIAMGVEDWWSALIVVLTVPLIPVFGVLVGLATRERAEKQWQARSDLAGHFLDVMRGLPTLVAFRRARAQAASIREVTDRYRRASLDTLRIAFMSSGILELAATISVAVVAVIVGVRLAGGHMDLRPALTVLLLAPEAYWPLRRVGAEFHAAADGAVVLEQIHDLLSLDIESHDRSSGVQLAELMTATESPGLTVLVGPSGAGKSTLLDIVAGLVDAPGHDNAHERRERTAYISQRPGFVPGNVRANLQLAAPEGGDAQFREALDRVGLSMRIGSLDDSLDEDGVGLSAGERSRLALARALLSERPVVVLDEPTAHLDLDTEQQVVKLIAEMSHTRSVIVASHRGAIQSLSEHGARVVVVG